MRSSSDHPARPAIRLVAIFVLALVLLLVGCYRVRSQLIATQASPEDLYRCVQLELGRAGYAIVGADRASGWLQAQKRVRFLLDIRRAEIYATVIPEEGGGGAQLQLTDNTYAEDDAEMLRSRCAPSAADRTVA